MATSVKSVTFLLQPVLLNLRIISLVFLTDMNAEMNSIACHIESKLFIYCIISGLLDAAQSNIALLNARAGEFCSKCLVECTKASL